MAHRIIDPKDRGFTWLSQSYYARSALPSRGDDLVDELMIGYYPPEGGTYGEFAVEFMRSHGDVVARLRVFDDAWRVLGQCQDLVSALAEFDDSSSAKRAAPESVAAVLMRLGFRDLTKRDNRNRIPIPDLYTVYHGSAWFAHEGALMAAPIKADGSVEWESICDVESTEKDELEQVRSICAMFGIADATQRFM